MVSFESLSFPRTYRCVPQEGHAALRVDTCLLAPRAIAVSSGWGWGEAGCTDAQLKALPPNWNNRSCRRGSYWVKWPTTPEWKGKPLPPRPCSLDWPPHQLHSKLGCHISDVSPWRVTTEGERHSKARLSLQQHTHCGCYRLSGKWSHRFSHCQSQEH